MKNVIKTGEAPTPGRESILVITNHFPYGLYESFLENEIPVLRKHFDKVIILCRDVSSTDQRDVHGAVVHRVNPKSSLTENIITIWLCVINGRKVWQYIGDELKWLKEHNRKLTSFIFNDLVHVLIKALQTVRHVRRILGAEGVTDHVVLYSYWLSSALALTFVPGSGIRLTTVSRAHGGDVYEYRNEHRYLPFRRTLIRHLHRVFAISDDAAAHLRRQSAKTDADKVQVARLGTPFAGTSPPKTSKQFTLVSCSFLVPVKRVHLLIDALSATDFSNIHWIHIGGGPLEDSLANYARETLSHKSNITYRFLGSLPNEQLMQFYRDTYVDVFVNTSSAEGVPVTIMEAQSFGIPVIAPRVGGIPEIVSDESGRLFDPDSSPLYIARLIAELLAMSATDVKAMRDSALQNWKTRYNADRNFSTFVADIQNLR